MVEVLPSYERPPVIEVAVGIHFLQLPGLNTVTLVHLVDRWRDRYPEVKEQGALPPMGGPAGGFTFEVVGNTAVPVRLWALNEDQSLLIQVQHDRLLINWRKQSGDAAYPRYDVLREELATIWADFEHYIGDGAKFGILRPSAAEVTFFNRIPVSSAAVIPQTIEALSPSFQLDSHVATRLQIERQLGGKDDGHHHGRQTITLSYPAVGEAFQLEIASIVAIDGEPSSLDVMSALDFAHKEGVLMFDRFTTRSAHIEWGKRDASS